MGIAVHIIVHNSLVNTTLIRIDQNFGFELPIHIGYQEFIFDIRGIVLDQVTSKRTNSSVYMYVHLETIFVLKLFEFNFQN